MPTARPARSRWGTATSTASIPTAPARSSKAASAAPTLSSGAPDDTTFYFTDSFANIIYAYDFDAATGEIANRRDWFDATDDPSLGVPDGSEIDDQGFIWNTRYGGSCVLRLAPDGTIDRKIDLPVSRITSAIFGGPNLETLYIVTAWNGADEAERAEYPLAGSIFAIDPGARGIPQVPYAG